MRQLATTVVFLLLAASSAIAEMRVTLPLAGYYRPGMCMPVRVDGATPPGTGRVELTADGAVPTGIVIREGRINAVLPFLAARAIGGMHVNGVKIDAPLHALPDGVRFIGTTLPATRPSTAPTAESLLIPLDPLDPVPGPAMAWEAMDELVVDAAGAARLGEQKLLGLLAFGVAIVVPGEAQPAVSLPWRREGGGWAVRFEPLGPRGSVFAPAMLPVAGWQPGLPDRVRRQALLAAVLFAILGTAVAMWRTRPVVLALAALIVVSVAAIAAWQSQQPTIRWIHGTIAIQSGSLTQRDEWRYALASEPLESKLLMSGRVMAESPDALLEQANLLQLSFPRGSRVALLSRTLSTDSAVGRVDPTLTSPLLPLAKAGYLRPGVAVVGQIPDHPWPTVVLRASEQ